MSSKDLPEKELKNTSDEVEYNYEINQHQLKAIETLIIGCQIAQKQGVYSLIEARTIMNAIEVLNTDKEK